MKFKKSIAVILVLVMCLTLFAGCGEKKEEASEPVSDYPNKTITAICPYAAGGGTDACLRAFCEALGKQLGQTVVVDNRTGGGGVTGHKAILDSENDGYTIGMITFELSCFDKLGVADFSIGDYDLFCLVNADAAGVSVNAKWAADNNIATLADFVEYCKAHPGEVRMGGAGNASVWHIAGGFLMQAAGIDIQMITYQEGAAGAVKDAAGGFIEGVTISVAEAKSFIESGDLICLGVMDTERLAGFPDVPTLIECGYDTTCYAWRGMAAPKGIPENAYNTLREAMGKAINDADFITFMNNASQKIYYLDTPEFETFLQAKRTETQAAMDLLGL